MSCETLILQISDILSASQGFLRSKNDECSFVSLRDVQRCLKIMVWFYKHDSIFAEMDEVIARKPDYIDIVTDNKNNEVTISSD